MKHLSTHKYTLAAAAAILTLGVGLVITSSVVLASPAQSQQAAPAQSQAPAAPQKPAGPLSRLPDEKGKDTLIRVCGKCHSPAIVIANGQNREGWEATITKMAGLGASASDEEFTDILDFLVKNCPPMAAKVNINKATSAEIEGQLGFTTKQAEDIVAYRQKNGDFKTLDDLKKVPAMNPTDVETRKNNITF
ncbi:MAG: helix-hairpin-helix domain-containing protein [Acidobacteria bacterium]|nr:helix-hairpin-helix domain-containing protein [Acidobacteriota bacterium]